MATSTSTSRSSLLLAKKEDGKPYTLKEYLREIQQYRRIAALFWLCVSAVPFACVFLFALGPTGLWSCAAVLTAVVCLLLATWVHLLLASVRYESTAKLFVPSRLLLFGALWLLTTLLFICVTTSLTSSEGAFSSSLTFLVPCKETRSLDQSVRSVFCLDERSLFVLVAASLLSAFLVGQRWQGRLFVLSFPVLQQPRWFRLKARMVTICHSALIVTSVGELLLYAFYFLWGSWTSAWVASFITMILQRPVYVYPPLWVDDGVLLPHVSLLGIAGLVTVAAWHFATALVEVTLTQNKSFDVPSQAGKLLLEALVQDKDQMARHLALQDLCMVSRGDGERRRRLFANMDDEPSWEVVLRVCCEQLDQLTIRLQESTLRHLESPSIRQTAMQRVYGFLVGLNPTARPFVHQPVFYDYQTVAWAAESMANLIALSKEEDVYGVVQGQNSVPRCLNSLLSCLVTVKQHVQSVPVQNVPKGLEGHQLLAPYATALSATLNMSVYRVTTAFHLYLADYEFPEELVPSLQSFAAFQQ